MSDIIHLLPDSVANQIAAGEVIQRPASVVKELVENAVDAGADEITLVIKDSGRTLIQVIDNGMGMSDTDARLSFERHATSKIKTAGDLFAIRTKGFRGEALASIAAIAHVVLKTRKPADEIGTEIIINGSEIEHQVPVSCASGSNFQVKNLFFNVPVRRKFLKSNTTELKHIINEFQRIVITHPEVAFNLSHNDTDIYRLPRTNLRQRIIHVFGKGINVYLNNIDTKTNIANISGYIGKPEFARKTSGEQFFFVNKRYMRHAYLHNAVLKAYENILPAETFPSYFIFFDAAPDTIDVNIHPTKTEIKFEDEKALYQIVRAAVREALGRANVAPSIDFETQGVIDIPVLTRNTVFSPPEISFDPQYNPFNEKPSGNSHSNKKTSPPENWENLYLGINNTEGAEIDQQINLFDEEQPPNATATTEYIQLKNKYIVTPVKSGLMLIDQKLAHERILFDQFIQNVAHNRNTAQRELYPTRVDLEPSDYILLNEIKDELENAGIEICDLGSNTISVNSCPTGYNCSNLKSLIEQLLEEYKTTGQKVGPTLIKAVACSLAKTSSIGYGKTLQMCEMQKLVDELFACEDPNYSPGGKKIVVIVPMEELDKLMN